MAFDYEALVGHLYIVGGRSISAAPPGTLVEVAPRKAARGREGDTLFVLVLPSGDTAAPAAFYEQMSQLAAEKYFASGGSVTAGLRTVFETLNENLYEHNQTDRRRYEASLLCAVLRGADLIIGKVGGGVALIRHEGMLLPFPASFDDDDALFGAPLGVQPVPDPKLTRYTVTTGTRLVLSDPVLAEQKMDALTSALAAEDIAGALALLRDLFTTQAALLVAEFVPPEAPVPLPSTVTLREGESTRALASPRPAAPPVAPNKPDQPEKPKRPPMPSPLEAPARETVSRVTMGMATGTRAAGQIMDRLLPPPQTGAKSWWQSPLAIGAAVLVPIVVVVMVIALWVSGTGESEFDLCVERVTEAAAVARSIVSSDVAGTLAAWNAVIAIADECAQLRAGDAALDALVGEGRAIIDRLLQVDRRTMTPITTFPNAGLTRLVLQGEDLYTLDDRNDVVYRVKLTTDGRAVVPGTQQPIPSMRRTAAVAEFTIGDVLDIAWAEDSAGLSQGSVLVALDSNGVLIECPPRFLESLSCEAQRLLGTETWVSPRAITLWQGRLYVLDTGANQLWRYEPGASAFANSPTEYFVGDGRPDIRNAMDFAIDDNGQVYVLFSDGVLRKFSSGQNVPFGFASFPEGQTITGAQAMFLNTNPIAQGLYIVHQAQRTVYETTLAGTFIAAYRPQDETLFASLEDVVVDANQRMIYAASGNAVLVFERSAPAAP